MGRQKIAFINESTVMADAELLKVVQALQIQIDRDLRPTWGIAAELDLLPKGTKPPADYAWMGIFDDSDQAGALGYHDLTPKFFKPVGKVFAKTDLQYNAKVSVTLSHETVEMLGDPYIGDMVLDPHTGRVYAKENADAVEADGLGYLINGVTVSDFVLPEYFDPNHAGLGKPLSFKGNVTEPFSLAPGGYMSYLDLNELKKGWQQVTADGQVVTEEEVNAVRNPGERHQGFPVGSRRHRRILASRGALKVSEVETA